MPASVAVRPRIWPRSPSVHPSARAGARRREAGRARVRQVSTPHRARSPPLRSALRLTARAPCRRRAGNGRARRPDTQAAVSWKRRRPHRCDPQATPNAPSRAIGYVCACCPGTRTFRQSVAGRVAEWRHAFFGPSGQFISRSNLRNPDYETLLLNNKEALRHFSSFRHWSNRSE